MKAVLLDAELESYVIHVLQTHMRHANIQELPILTELYQIIMNADKLPSEITEGGDDVVRSE